MPWWYDMLATCICCYACRPPEPPLKSSLRKTWRRRGWSFWSLYAFAFLNLISWNCRKSFFSQQVSTPINTEISACCTICRNWAISPRFKLTWRIRAWQQRRRWNCYRRWWTWWDCRIFMESFWMNLTLYAEGHFFFEMMVTDVIEMVGMFFLGFLIFGGREEQTWGPDVPIPTRGWTMPLECVAHGWNHFANVSCSILVTICTVILFL